MCKMKNILYIEKKLRNSHIVWLQESNQYLKLKNPAFDIFQFIAKNTTKDIIYSYLMKKYGFSFGVCQQIVSDIEREIAKINIPVNSNVETKTNPNCAKNRFIPYSTRLYAFGEKIFSVSFENKYLENWLHPMFSHLESTKEATSTYHFEILNCNGNIVFRERNKLQGIISENKSIHDVEKIFLHLANILFDKSENDWLMTVHASAISNKKKTILFTASSGGGKTTLAALLLQKEFHLVSDDFVMIDKQKRAYNFPSAMSVKQGAIETLLPGYPELIDKTEIQVSPEKKVRYLTKGNYKNNPFEIYPVNEIVFVQYNPKIDFKLTRISCFKGIKAFLEQTYITPDPECAEIFLEWALQASFYRLSYSDTNLAQNAMIQLFEHEK
jgi:hypothetical protein